MLGFSHSERAVMGVSQLGGMFWRVKLPNLLPTEKLRKSTHGGPPCNKQFTNLDSNPPKISKCRQMRTPTHKTSNAGCAAEEFDDNPFEHMMVSPEGSATAGVT